MLFPWAAAGKPRDRCKAEALPKSLGLDGICNASPLCAHQRGCVVEQPTRDLHPYIVQRDERCSSFSKWKASAELRHLTNPILINDVMIRQNGLDFEGLITSVLFCFCFISNSGRQRWVLRSFLYALLCSCLEMMIGNKPQLLDHGDLSAVGEDAISQWCQLCPPLIPGMVPHFWSFDLWGRYLLTVVLGPLRSCLGDTLFFLVEFFTWQEVKHFVISLSLIHTFGFLVVWVFCLVFFCLLFVFFF